MKHSLTICYVTTREHPEILWFFNSLLLSSLLIGSTKRDREKINIIVVDGCESKTLPEIDNIYGIRLRWVRPKPNFWSGPSRLTKENWWSVANSRNTALCLCETEWISFLDDRSVLLPGWLDAIERAMEGNYIVAGAYEKRTAMTVENGVIRNAGIVSGEDSREKYVRDNKLTTPFPCPGQWLFGCNLAMPLEWALQVNGYSETLTDGLSFEDVPFGLVLEANGFPVKFEPSMKIIEDRTPELCGPVIRRTDKGVSPKDKSHKVLELIAGQKQSPNPFNLRQMRAHVQAGGAFPAPSGLPVDWFDGQPIRGFV